MTSVTIASVTPYFVEIERDEPYLGALRSGEEVNEKGYFVRAGNRTVYSHADRSVLLRIETTSGLVGWGETYGIVSPRAVMEIIRDLFTPFLIDRDPRDVTLIYEDLYDLMRVRGSSGGLYHDALAAVDIALWDICGKLANLPVAVLLGGRRHARIPAYVSGLPGSNQAERIAVARKWQADGFDSFKFASPVVEDVVDEFRALRDALGAQARIAADLHWHYGAAEAIGLAKAVERYRPWFLEAPCAPEDIEGLAHVTRASSVPIAAGEEWRTVHELGERLGRCKLAVIQPEMGHTGITQFARMGAMAGAAHVPVIPHATIGLGLFLCASLQVAASLQGTTAHEFQHTVLSRSARFVQGGTTVSQGFYTVPDGPGLGVEPSSDCLSMLRE
jgi:galactonate dehydratase